MRLVPDTDVLVSGLRSMVGASRVLLLAVQAGVVPPLVSVATVIEYEAVPKREENLQAARLDAEDVDRFLDDLVAHADHIFPRFRTRPSIQDPGDEMFAEAAINGQADARFRSMSGINGPRAPTLASAHPGLPTGRHPEEALMATISNFALRIPPSLMEDVKSLATQDAVSVNQFLVQAAAEKVATLKARGYLAERGARAVAGDLGRILAEAGTPTPIPGDELPEGWPEKSAAMPGAAQVGGAVPDLARRARP